MVCSILLVLTVAVIGSVHVFAGSTRQLPIYCVKTDDKRIAISFDAAWGNDDTGTLINILAKYNIKATFFVVGAWVDKYPESVKQLSDAGHQVNNHSNTHPHMPKLSAEQMKAELQQCNEKIAKITGVTPTLFRAPYGDYNNAMLDTVSGLGMYTIQWDVDSKDWMEGHTAQMITNDVVNKVKPGSIVLFHNDADNTPEALPGILENLLAKGYTFVPISELIYKDNYVIEHDGTQAPKAPVISGTTTSAPNPPAQAAPTTSENAQSAAPNNQSAAPNTQSAPPNAPDPNNQENMPASDVGVPYSEARP